MAITLAAGNNIPSSDKDAWEHIQHARWDDQYVRAVYFTLDKQKYIQFMLTWTIDGKKGSGYGNDWSGTYMEFMRGPGMTNELPNEGGNSWRTSSTYFGSDFVAPSYGHMTSNDNWSMWGASGDGATWYGTGFMLITVPDNYINYGTARAVGGLATNNNNTSPYFYVEDSSGTYTGHYSRDITAIKVFGSGGSFSASRRGQITLQGIRR